MSSYKQIIYQIVFSTKNRENYIDQNRCNELYQYIWGIVKNKKGHLYRINGMPNHVHIVCDLHPSIALADFVREIKQSSSRWMRERGFQKFNGWNEGYAAFTYNYKDKENVIAYVMNQQEHHTKENYLDECKRLFHEHGVEFDERFMP